jgi:hypothetical protein
MPSATLTTGPPGGIDRVSEIPRPRIQEERFMRRHVRKLLFGVGFVLILTPFECAEWYCDRHSDFPPICDVSFPA